MNSLYPHDLDSYLNILLVFFRFMAFIVLVPGLSHKAIPTSFKVLFSLTLSLSIYPVVKPYLILLDGSFSGFVIAAIRETSIGLLMGFVCYLTFESIQLAAQLLGLQMGLGTAALLDPVNQANVSLIVPLHTWMALSLFFIGNFHHETLYSFISSFYITRKNELTFMGNKELLAQVIGISAKLFSLSVRISAPITALILLTNMMIGVLARLIPQMNVILFSFPITIVLSLAGIYIFAPDTLDFFTNILEEMGTDIMTTVRVL